MNMMDVWIFLETIFFFSQIVAGMSFLAHVFYSPAEKFTENPENKKYDENPYND
jgi:hypothetical protein